MYKHTTKIIDLAPQPSSLIGSLRDIGYSFQSAVADIIDNSIAAQATVLDIQTEWNDGDPYLAIIDDGIGMTEEELIASMRFGCINPLRPRAQDDLGRFGLGMKTASISQCKRLTVLSKKNDHIHACVWDLDILCRDDSKSWALEILDCSSLLPGILAELHGEFLTHYESGTIVLWEKMDRLERSDNSAADEKGYSHLVALLNEHLDLTYHRFIKPDIGSRKTVMRINGGELTGFNPFNSTCMTTIEGHKQYFNYQGEIITAQAFILPHHSKVSPQEYKRYGGEEGYLNNQGFYIYRNKRLIVKGTWFRLVKKEELTKLIRVQVDIPNTLDHIWRIDIKKSDAQIPDAIKNQLKRIIARIQTTGKNVYRQKGHRIKDSILSPIWERVVVNKEILYRVNRDNPFYRELTSLVPVSMKKNLQDYISMLEACFPKDLLFTDMGASPETLVNTALDQNTVYSLLESFINITSCIHEDEILRHEPFCQHQNLVREYLANRGI